MELYLLPVLLEKNQKLTSKAKEARTEKKMDLFEGTYITRKQRQHIIATAITEPQKFPNVLING